MSPAIQRALALLLLVLTTACSHPSGPSTKVPLLVYEQAAPSVPIAYSWSRPDDAYLATMRDRYALTELAVSATSPLARARIISRWVHTQFAHDGDNASRYADPMGILDEAANGERFRCVEYAAVTSGALNSLGIPARMVWLLTRSEPTRSDGIAHVVAEAYLHDIGKWVMVDAQWDVIPARNGVPLSAWEFQQSLASGARGLHAESLSGTPIGQYARWVAPYLYYFYSPTDNRVGVARTAGAVLLTPVGDTRLVPKYPANVNRHTHSVPAFYPPLD